MTKVIFAVLDTAHSDDAPEVRSDNDGFENGLEDFLLWCVEHGMQYGIYVVQFEELTKAELLFLKSITPIDHGKLVEFFECQEDEFSMIKSLEDRKLVERDDDDSWVGIRMTSLGESTLYFHLKNK